MKIAVLAHIRHAIAEPFGGGMEAHCDMLCRGLRAAGHQVDLFAADGSQDESLVPICAAPYDEVLPWRVFRGTSELAAYQRDAFERVLLAVGAGAYDVVHNNSLFPEIIEWCARAGIPCVTSQHVPPFGAMFDAVAATRERPNIGFTVTSQDQQALWADRGCAGLDVVPNGIDTNRWVPLGEPQDYLTWVGRIVPNKGLAEAIQAARKARVRLRIFGPVEDAGYFTEKVEPFLSEGIEFHGHRSGDRLRAEVAGAQAALVTPLWDEPFGLVAAEALACGTPVAGFDRGALSEVVGDCGVLVPGGDIGALAHAIRKVRRIDRAACRARAVEKLSITAMIAGYERCYAGAIAGARLASLPRLAWDSSCSRTSELLA
ncbi:glycosyltransferase family 4 protein [Qipengyuania citrea]|uniref:glycosyltransferase family 4 protein n=1 Tax=Qipengyuania citrea TaxID=225971 RepID=UPI001E57CCA3|nr:glycosyltransferase family 4 protein [Qipengyuania citrea]MCD1589765.1 glycosyltransferase family 4 protein [Qipengyuania citrea]